MSETPSGHANGIKKYDLLLKGGHVIDPANNIDTVMDVAVSDKKIACVGMSIPYAAANKVVDLSGFYVTPGLVDIHVHVFLTFESWVISVDPDYPSRSSGVTTTVDAGTSGANHFEEFKKIIDNCSKVRVLAFLNIAADGMTQVSEDDPSQFNVGKAVETTNMYSDIIIGYKTAHYWKKSDYEGQTPWKSVEKVIEAGEETGLPVMYHVNMGQGRTYKELVTERIRPGDIITHLFGPGWPSVQNGMVNPDLLIARERGVICDVGHGGGSFSFLNAVPAFEQGFLPDSISSDLWGVNINGVVKNLANVMSKFLAMGVSLEEVIRRSTINPAREINRSDLGSLSEGMTADIAVFRLKDSPAGFNYYDVTGNSIRGNKKLECVMTVFGGDVVYDIESLYANATVGVEEFVKHDFGLISTFPNPFNMSTNITFVLSNTENIELCIYNSIGQKVKTLAARTLFPGRHSFVWNGKTDDDISVTSGVYFAVLRSNSKKDIRRMVLIK